MFYGRYHVQRIREKVAGVDFSSPLSKEQAGTGLYQDALYYASSAYVPELKKAMKFCRINASDAILDYGSGKGAVLVELSKYPFKKICGVEISPVLLEIANRNFERLGVTNVTTILADATHYYDIDEYNYFYFFNPFEGAVFKAVIRNIVLSAEREPRSVRIIYYHPKCHQLIMDTGRFKVEKTFVDAARKMNIYKLNAASN